MTAMEKALHAADTPMDRFYFVACGGARTDASPDAGEAVADLRGRLSGYAPRAARDHAYWRGAPCSMLVDEVETIWTAIDTRDDWRPFDAKNVTIPEIGAALAGRAGGAKTRETGAAQAQGEGTKQPYSRHHFHPPRTHNRKTSSRE